MLYRLFAIVLSVVLLSACCGSELPARSAANAFVERLNAATVAIVQRDGEDIHVGCSGVWLDANHILTAAHCVDDVEMSEIDVILSEIGVQPNKLGRHALFLTYSAVSGKTWEQIKETESATIVAFNKSKDLAILATKTDQPHATLEFADSMPRAGDMVHASGMTYGLPFSYSPGVVGAIRTMENTKGVQEEVIQVVGGMGPGNSGGPLVNTNGQLVGVCSFVIRGSVLVFYVSLDEIKEFIKASDVIFS